ncbi:MAG: CoA transferase [Pseudomonadales bacterium]|jgi:crotonobetainyl-CoA:carnitine CoA-transferase CaiB-like acyl-CoA transferase|nr:CoA transferase [Pseudomonadales bacterium]
MTMGALSNITVVELAEGVAGPYCGRILAAHGARVIKVEIPGTGDPARSMFPRREGLGRQSGGMFAWLNANKQSIALDVSDPSDAASIRQVCAGAQVVIDNISDEQRSEAGLDAASLRSENPELIVCNVTWFGQTGPYRDYAGNDAVCAALAGLAFGIGEVEGPPTLPSGYEPQVIAGVTATIAVMTALISRAENSIGYDIDLGILESCVVLHETGAIARSYDMDSVPRRFGVNRYPPTYPMGVYKCGEGWVGVTALTPAQWRSLCDLLKIPEYAVDPQYFTSIGRFIGADELDAVLLPAFLRWSARDLMEQGQAMRIPLTLVPTPEEMLVLPEFVERGALSTISLTDGAEFDAPGIPFRLEGTPGDGSGTAPDLDQHRAEILQNATGRSAAAAHPTSSHAPPTERPLQGIRIVDLSMGWSGPLAARYCADLGAEVIKVEACQYPDWWRGWEKTKEWVEERRYEKLPSFNSMNRNKLGITLDLTRKEGADLLKRLVKDADAVIENNTSTVLPKLGLDYPHLKEVNPEIIMISMPAFGMASPWSHHRAYGSTVEQASGLPHLNGRAEWPPTQQHVALGDPVAGINAAVGLLIALYHKQQTGEGQFIDFSQVESVLPLGAHGIIEQSMNGRSWPRLGSRHPECAPHGVYRCDGEESWLAVTCFTDRQWQAFAVAIGREDLPGDARFRDSGKRKDNEDALDEVIAAWTIERSAQEAMSVLQGSAVPAGVVTSTQNLLDDEHLQARGFFEWAKGVHADLRLYPLPAFRMSGERQGVRWPAPMLGEHNDTVLKGKLGLSEVEMHILADKQIIGTVPII